MRKTFPKTLETDEKYSGWSDAVKITNFGHVIDEFSAVFGSNQEIFLCAKMFNQKNRYEGTLSVPYNFINNSSDNFPSFTYLY